MDRFLTYLGGIIGGYTLIETPVAGTFLSGLNPLLDVVGALSMIVFGGAFIFDGLRYIFRR